jgi:hypothetical protein
MDPRCAPEGVRESHLPNQSSDFRSDLRETTARSRPPGPIPRKAATMPRDNRGGADDHQGRFPLPPRGPQPDPEQAIGPTHDGLRPGSPIESQLLSQRQILESQSALSAREDEQEPNNVDDPSDHWFSIAGPADVADA